MPRLPEHCNEYVRMLQWPKEQPFGDGVLLDEDDPEQSPLREHHNIILEVLPTDSFEG